MNTPSRSLAAFLALFALAGLTLIGCTAVNPKDPIASSPIPALSPTESVCPVTEPVWAKPPEDSAVDGSPAYGYYFVNKDRSVWASAWWAEQEENYLWAGEEGVKVGWFRPAGAALEITGRRIDGQAPPLEAHAPCCYPTRFQATGLMFPTEGCWEVAARAGGSELTFVLWVESE